MLDLYNNHYSRDILKKHIYDVNLIDIIKTQILDDTFVVRYILNKNYQLLKEEEEITIDYVLFFQPHLIKENVQQKLQEYDKDDDSITDFETISKE
jgi:hypothetical protein